MSTKKTDVSKLVFDQIRGRYLSVLQRINCLEMFLNYTGGLADVNFCLLSLTTILEKKKKWQSQRVKLPLQGKMRLTSVKGKTVISHFCDAKHLCQEAYCQHLLTPRRSRATEHVNYLSSSNCRLRKCNSKKIILQRKSEMDLCGREN